MAPLANRALAAAALAACAGLGAQELDDNLRRAGFTALHAAVWNGDVASIRRQVREGADVNVAAQSGTTPLHSAAMKPDPDVVRALLDLGASLEARDKEGRTPLFISAEVNPQPGRVIEVLLAAGASPDAKDKFGKTARDACWKADACQALGARRSTEPARR